MRIELLTVARAGSPPATSPPGRAERGAPAQLSRAGRDAGAFEECIGRLTSDHTSDRPGAATAHEPSNDIRARPGRDAHAGGTEASDDGVPANVVIPPPASAGPAAPHDSETLRPVQTPGEEPACEEDHASGRIRPARPDEAGNVVPPASRGGNLTAESQPTADGVSRACGLAESTSGPPRDGGGDAARPALPQPQVADAPRRTSAPPNTAASSRARWVDQAMSPATGDAVPAAALQELMGATDSGDRDLAAAGERPPEGPGSWTRYVTASAPWSPDGGRGDDAVATPSLEGQGNSRQFAIEMGGPGPGARREARMQWTFHGSAAAGAATMGEGSIGVRFVAGLETAGSGGSVAAASEASAYAGAVPEDVLPQIVKAVRLQWRQGIGEARLRLEPERLGEIHVALRVQDGVVSAALRAEHPAVQAWIEARQQDLRNALSQQGLILDQFEVAVSPDGRRRSQPDFRGARPPRSRPAQAATDFEVHA